MNELIEKLKDNKVAWIFLSKEEQACMKQVNEQGHIENLKYDGKWEDNEAPWGCLGEGANEIFRIKPDYQADPEYIDIEIVVRENGELWLKEECPSSHYQWLWWAICDKDFMYFFYVAYHDGQVTTYIPGEATQWVHQGKAVSARFRRE